MATKIRDVETMSEACNKPRECYGQDKQPAALQPKAEKTIVSAVTDLLFKEKKD